MVLTMRKCINVALFVVATMLNVEAAEGDIRVKFETEYPALMRQGTELCQRIFDLVTSGDPAQTLAVLNDISDFLGDRSSFKQDDADAMVRYQSAGGVTLLDENSPFNRIHQALMQSSLNDGDFSEATKALLCTDFSFYDDIFSHHASYMSDLENSYVFRIFMFERIFGFLQRFYGNHKYSIFHKFQKIKALTNEDNTDCFLRALPHYKVDMTIGLTKNQEVHNHYIFERAQFEAQISTNIYVNVVCGVDQGIFVDSQIVKIAMDNMQFFDDDEVFGHNVKVSLDTFFKGEDFQTLLENYRNRPSSEANQWRWYFVMF